MKKINTKAGWLSEVEDAGLDTQKLSALVARAPEGCESEVAEIENHIEKCRSETTDMKNLKDANLANKRLVDGAQENDLNEVRAALCDGADVHAWDDAALRLAASSVSSYFPMSPNMQDAEAKEDEGIWRTQAAEQVQILKALLSAGANVNACDDEALMSAIECRRVDVVQVLVAAGADVQVQGGEGLRRAAVEGAFGIVQVLLATLAGDSVARSNGLLEWAMLEVVYRLRSSQITPGDKATDGRFKVLLALLGAGADVRADESKALRLAAEISDVRVVKLLLAAGADVNACDDEALMNAVRNNHPEVVSVLTSAGAGADIERPNSKTMIRARALAWREILDPMRMAWEAVNRELSLAVAKRSIEVANKRRMKNWVVAS